MGSPNVVRRVERQRTARPGRQRLRGVIAQMWAPDRRPFVLALALALAGALGFAHVAEDFVTNDPLARWDLSFARWLAGHRSTTGIDFFRVVTAIGSPAFAVALGLLVFIVLYRRRRLADAALLPLALGGAELLNLILKLSFHRARPDVAFVHLDTYSFPSGHAMASTVTWGALAFLAWGRMRTNASRALLIAGLFVVVFLIGFSRLYLGVHYLSDVLGGVAAGASWLGLSLAAHALWGGRFAAWLEGSAADRFVRRVLRG